MVRRVARQVQRHHAAVAEDIRVGGGQRDLLARPAPALELLKSLRSGTYQMRVDQDVHARATGSFEDADSAKTLADMARGLIAVAKLQVAKQEPDMLLLHLLDGVHVTDSGTSVVVNIDEPGGLLKKLRDLRMNRSLVQ